MNAPWHSCGARAALAELLPGQELAAHAPYARVYWSKEGMGNGRMNRYGWYYPDPSHDAGSETTLLIGDSFVEGLQIDRHQNVGAVLEAHLNRDHHVAAQHRVISLGMSGIGPAQYLELLRHGIEHYTPARAVIFLFLGNDLRNASYRIQANLEPQNYVYYQLTEAGGLRLHPDSQHALTWLRSRLNLNLEPDLETMTRSVSSYFLLPRMAMVVAERLRARRSNRRAARRSQGLDSSFFRNPLTDAHREAVAIAEALLIAANELGTRHEVEVYFVTVPFFPQEFYQAHAPVSSSWSMSLGETDYLLPEKLMEDIATRHNLNLYPTGRRLGETSVTPRQLKEMHFSRGSGHWTEAGHAYYAELVSSLIGFGTASDSEKPARTENSHNSREDMKHLLPLPALAGPVSRSRCSAAQYSGSAALASSHNRSLWKDQSP